MNIATIETINFSSFGVEDDFHSEFCKDFSLKYASIPSLVHTFNAFVDSIKELPREEQKEILNALSYADKQHQGQCRKNAERTPYIIHPIGVALILTKESHVFDKDILITALLHDTIEDTPTVFEDLLELFGTKISSYVLEVTKDPNLASEENKQRTIDHAKEMTLEARIVKLADRLYNVRDTRLSPSPEWDIEKILSYRDWGRKLLEVCSGITHPELEKALAEELCL